MSIIIKQRQFWTKIGKCKMSVAKVALVDGNCAPMSIDIGGMRVKYNGKHETFTEDDLTHKEPIGQFKTWFDEACKTPGILEANAMCISTATKSGIPSGRYVLLKGYGKTGFKFFSNYDSRKGKELAENPRAALTFYWEVLKRSIRVEGTVEKLMSTESDEYFHSRPFASQLGACASHQSVVIPSRDLLMKRETELADQYQHGKEIVERPECWGGYLVIPEAIEFWQGQSDRLHDRIKFRKQTANDVPDGVLLHQGEEGWVYERLSP